MCQLCLMSVVEFIVILSIAGGGAPGVHLQYHVSDLLLVYDGNRTSCFPTESPVIADDAGVRGYSLPSPSSPLPPAPKVSSYHPNSVCHRHKGHSGPGPHPLPQVPA